MKFAVDRSLEGRRYETDPIGPSLKRVLRYWTVRNKFEEARIHPDLAEIGVTNIRVEDQGLVFEREIQGVEKLPPTAIQTQERRVLGEFYANDEVLVQKATLSNGKALNAKSSSVVLSSISLDKQEGKTQRMDEMVAEEGRVSNRSSSAREADSPYLVLSSEGNAGEEAGVVSLLGLYQVQGLYCEVNKLSQ